MRQRQNGFTLIEMLIVVTLLAIVLGLAVPSYRNYTLRAGRADATNALLRIAAAQEKFYLQNGIYATNAQLQQDRPAGLGFDGGSSERGYYTLAVTDEANLATGYTATATVVSTDKQKDDTDCSSFSLDQDGRRGANGGYAPATVEKCWR